MSRYPSLFAPSIWGSQRSKPRVDGLNAYRAGGASGRGRASGGLYAERARHGVALIVTGVWLPRHQAWGWKAERCLTMRHNCRTIAL